MTEYEIKLLGGIVKVVEDDKDATIVGTCVITKKEHKVIVPAKGFRLWLDGAIIQNALPNVSAGDREFLMSGISPAGWNSLFPGEEE